MKEYYFEKPWIARRRWCTFVTTDAMVTFHAKFEDYSECESPKMRRLVSGRAAWGRLCNMVPKAPESGV